MGSGSSFVGRTAELALLSAQAAAAGRGEGRVVLIGGEPGIGKTRLAGEAAGPGPAARVRPGGREQHAAGDDEAELWGGCGVRMRSRSWDG